MRLPVNTVIHTTLVDLEPATFRSLVRRATSSATEPTVSATVRHETIFYYYCEARTHSKQTDGKTDEQTDGE